MMNDALGGLILPILVGLFIGWVLYRCQQESVAGVELRNAQAHYLRSHDALPGLPRMDMPVPVINV